MKRITLLMLLTSMLVLLGLTGCEIPAPGSENLLATSTAAAQATMPALATTDPGTIILPPVGASPTPALVVTPDPNQPLPTDLTPTVDPAVQPGVEPTAETAPPPAEPTPETSSTGEIIHIVQPGDNLYRIGLQYGFTYQELAIYNGITNPDRLEVGQQIRIPPKP